MDRIVSGSLFLVQAGICCALFTRIGLFGQVDLVMVFCFILLQMVAGVRLGMKEEGLLSAGRQWVVGTPATTRAERVPSIQGARTVTPISSSRIATRLEP